MTASPFDEIIDRRSTQAYKWLRHDESVLPLWVADADFKCPQPILDAIQDRIEHGVLGYHCRLYWRNSMATDNKKDMHVAVAKSMDVGIESDRTDICVLFSVIDTSIYISSLLFTYV